MNRGEKLVFDQLVNSDTWTGRESGVYSFGDIGIKPIELPPTANTVVDSTSVETPSVSPDEKYDQFEVELRVLINRISMENLSDTPDWILAQYLTSCLEAFDKGINNDNPHRDDDIAHWIADAFVTARYQREEWYKPAEEKFPEMYRYDGPWGLWYLLLDTWKHFLTRDK